MLNALVLSAVSSVALSRGIEQGIERGIEQGMTQEARSLILRQLNRRFGTIAPNIESQIAKLSISQLESLGEALLDFSSAADLDEWLRSHS
jgi:predicted transposase YdaD